MDMDDYDTHDYRPYPEEVNRFELAPQHDGEHCQHCFGLDDDMWWAIYGDAGLCCCRDPHAPWDACDDPVAGEMHLTPA